MRLDEVALILRKISDCWQPGIRLCDDLCVLKFWTLTQYNCEVLVLTIDLFCPYIYLITEIII